MAKGLGARPERDVMTQEQIKVPPIVLHIRDPDKDAEVHLNLDSLTDNSTLPFLLLADTFPARRQKLRSSYPLFPIVTGDMYP